MKSFPRQGSILERPELPKRTYTAFVPSRPLSDWVENGEAVAGDEINRLAIPWHVLEAVNDNPPKYVVIGEETYSDGRHYLDFAVTERWSTSQLPICDECGGRGDHLYVEIPRKNGTGTSRVRCPNNPRSAPRPNR